MCAGVTIYKAIKQCGLQSGQRLGIVGCGGGLGHLGLQLVDRMRLKVTGVDATDAAIALATSLDTKADLVDARTTSSAEVVTKIGAEDGNLDVDKANMGVDVVIILSESQISSDYGISLLRNHGICIVLSLPEPGFRVSPIDLIFRGITVKGTILGTDEVLQETVTFTAKHNIRPKRKVFPLEDLNLLVTEHEKAMGGKLVHDLSSWYVYFSNMEPSLALRRLACKVSCFHVWGHDQHLRPRTTFGKSN